MNRTARFTRSALLVICLSFIGIAVGLACAILPPAAPFGLIGLLALLLLLVIPELRLVPETWARRMVAPLVFSIVCVPVYYALILPGLPWISFRRAVLFAWLIPLVICLAGSSQARAKVADVLRSVKALRFFLVAFAILAVVTTLTSVMPVASLNYLTLNVLNWFLPLIGVVYCIRSSQNVASLFKAAIIAATINCAAGLVETHLQRPFLVYLLPPYMREQIFQANSITRNALTVGQGIRSGVYRASSTYTTALTWGEISAMIVPMSLHFLAHGKSGLQKIFGLFGFGICVLSIVLSGSRGAYVGMILASLCYAVVWAIRYNIQNPSSIVGKIWMALFAVGATATVSAVLFVGRIRRAVLGGGEAQLSTDSRYAEWAQAKPKFFARPITGYGGGTATEVIHYASSYGDLSVDGFYMNLLIDYGIFGIILFFGMFMIAAFISFRLYLLGRQDGTSPAAAVGASLLAFMVYRMTLSQTDSLTMAFMLMGMAAALQFLNKQSTAVSRA